MAKLTKKQKAVTIDREKLHGVDEASARMRDRLAGHLGGAH